MPEEDLQEEPQAEEVEQGSEYLNLRKKIAKKRAEQSKESAKDAVGKMAGKAFINWAFGLSSTIFLIPITVLALDVYWFITITPMGSNLAKIGWIRGSLLAIMNIILLFIILGSFAIFYCMVNTTECGLEAAKSVIQSTAN